VKERIAFDRGHWSQHTFSKRAMSNQNGFQSQTNVTISTRATH